MVYRALGGTLTAALLLVNLMIVGLVASVLLGDESAIQFGYPIGLTLTGILAPVSGVGTIGVLICIVDVWRR